MSFEYVSVEEAIKRRGLRMVVVGDVPSPWGEAAKGFLHIKGIEWVAVRLTYDSEPLKEWAGQRSGPAAVYENERPRSGWAEISPLATGRRPSRRRVPAQIHSQPPAASDWPDEICEKVDSVGRAGLEIGDAGFNGARGFSEPVSKYLDKKYGYSPGRAQPWRPGR